MVLNCIGAVAIRRILTANVTLYMKISIYYDNSKDLFAKIYYLKSTTTQIFMELINIKITYNQYFIKSNQKYLFKQNWDIYNVWDLPW